MGYHPRIYLSQEKGTIKLVKGREESRWITLTDDVWTLVMKRRNEIKRLARRVLPYSRRQEKVAKMKLFFDVRNDDWAEMGPTIREMRHNTRIETNDAISRAEIEYKARHREPASGVVG